MPPGPSHRAPYLDRVLEVIGSLHHEIEHGLAQSNYTVAFKLGTRVHPNHKGLIVRFLFVTELHRDCPFSRSMPG
jgi:hypothetical protein